MQMRDDALAALELRGDSLFIGADVPAERVARDPLAAARVQALTGPARRRPRRRGSLCFRIGEVG